MTKIKTTWFRITHWETWNYLAKYIPIMPVWLYYCLRARSFWFFTPSNPTLTFGGFEGESKREMFAQLPPETYPRSIFLSPSLSFDDVDRLVSSAGFRFPVAVKPDVGMMGFMFRKIDNKDQLKMYHEAMPAEYIVQDLIRYPLEVSVFYYRTPDAAKGTITGFLKKEFLEVSGDGIHTLEELIDNYDRVRFRRAEIKSKHASRMNNILPAGETYVLSNALNLSRGGKLVSLAGEKDERLLAVFDKLSHYAQHFYYGRYDIKCASIESLKEGKDFAILEYNGCGAEPHHIYGNGHSLWQAYAIVLHHWKKLYEISRYNHRHGSRQWDFLKGWRFLKDAKKHFRILKQLDASIEL